MDATSASRTTSMAALRPKTETSARRAITFAANLVAESRTRSRAIRENKVTGARLMTPAVMPCQS